MTASLNMNVDFGSPLMLVLLAVGSMVLLNFLLPMLPSMPVLDMIVDASRNAQANLVGSALHVALVVYVAVVAKDMLRL